jgi:hypothetical protein
MPATFYHRPPTAAGRPKKVVESRSRAWYIRQRDYTKQHRSQSGRRGDQARKRCGSFFGNPFFSTSDKTDVYALRVLATEQLGIAVTRWNLRPLLPRPCHRVQSFQEEIGAPRERTLGPEMFAFCPSANRERAVNQANSERLTGQNSPILALVR